MTERCLHCGKPLVFPQQPYNDFLCPAHRLTPPQGSSFCGVSVKRVVSAADLFFPLTPDGAFIAGAAAVIGMAENHHVLQLTPKTFSGDILRLIGERLFGAEVFAGKTQPIQTLELEPAELAEAVIELSQNDQWLLKAPDSIAWSFVCGLFEAVGEFRYDYRHPEIRLPYCPKNLIKFAADLWSTPCSANGTLCASGSKALDICGRMYEHISWRNSKYYAAYMDILNWEVVPLGSWINEAYFKCKKLDPRAVIPQKTRVTDSGYDLYAIAWTYDPTTELYTADMGLAVEPIPGYYFDMVGRSSLPASGFMFAGGVGIIDRGYVGSLKMKMIKLRQNAPEPQLPFRCGQLIPRKILHIPFRETASLSDSDRGQGGFGSSGN